MYPNEVDTFPTRLKGETIEADHINLLQNAVTAIETTLDERSPSSSAVVPDMDYTPGADNTAAILTARAVAVSRNVPLLIPRGPHPWVMTDNLTLWDGARLILKGTLDIQTDHSAGGLGIIGTSVEDVVIDGGGTLSQSNAAARNGVYGMIAFLSSGGTGNGDVHIRNIRILGGESTAIFTVLLDTFSIHNVHVQDTWADGIHLSRGTSKGTVTACTVKSPGDDAIALVSITSESGGSVTWPQMTDIVVGDCVVTDFPATVGSGVAVIGARRCGVSNVTVKNPKANGVNIMGSSSIGAPPSSFITVNGANIEGAAGQGFLIGDSSDVTITGGSATGGADCGLQLIGSTRTHVAGVKLRGNAAFGVYETGGTGNTVAACDLRGNTTAPYQVSSAALTGCVTA